ncbi:VOC family protein [uncultured Methanomethylovorans sp.]|uniref:VOC family protein n=1 Tax=uncultured Methanomethylovorans sp. TaxID=183759 RepID=UPI002AA6B331|nr:VOC family protein [uncultured Methanomethylovorans sp.]
MQKIVPHLWFDKEATEAAKLYTSLLRDSKIIDITQIHGTPSGTAEMVALELSGQEFMLISAGPFFTFTPAISFLIACSSTEEVDTLWEQLSKDGTELMLLDAYPFSKRYTWVEDRYGLSWQVMHMGDRKFTQKITPTLMFTGDVCGKAEEAINTYTSVFSNSKVGDILRYVAGEGPDKEGTIQHASFMLEGQEFAAMDSAYEHSFTFNEAISFIVYCDTQDEIDYYWGKLSDVPEAEQCGWLKDKYGVSWQIVPTIMKEMMQNKDAVKLARVTEAFLKMKKFDIAELKKAYEGL